MKKARKGDTVSVHYTGKLTDGSIFDSSREKEPISFVIGTNQMIPGFDRGVEGMTEGEARTLTLMPEEAYGQRMEELVVTIGRDQLPDHLEPSVGQVLQLKKGDDTRLNAHVVAVSDTQVTLDGNSPLAGESLVFEIQVETILKAGQ